MQKSNSGFYAAAAVMLALASLFYAWKFVLPEYQKTQGQIAQADNEISAAKIKLDSLSLTRNSLDQLGDLVNKLFVAIPEDKDAPNLITELEAIGVKHKLGIPSIQISDSAAASSTSTAATGAAVAAAPSGLNPISVSFSVTGEFTQLNQFLATLEKDIRFTNVKSLTISEGQEGELVLAVQLEVYKRGVVAPAQSMIPETGNLSTTEASQ